MKFELGQKQGFIPSRYLLPFSISQNLIAGDRIWKKYESIIMEFEFIRYVPCGYQYQNSASTCKTCKGNVEIKIANTNKKIILCLSVTNKKSSLIKVIKKYQLPDTLFEI